MSRFGKISDIVAKDFEQHADTIYCTFDIDWACDEVLAYTIDLVEEAGVCAKWFVTHDTPLLKRLRENPKFELGIHPNFNNILAAKPDTNNGKSAEEIVDNLLALVPEATSVRSHSMAQSSALLQLFRDKGFTHDCNHFIPYHTGMELCPWSLWNGLIKVPYFWEDDVSALYGDDFGVVVELTQRRGLKVFDFHPIHVFLNTERMERYEESRPYHRSPEKLLAYCNKDTFGARTALKTLLELRR